MKYSKMPSSESSDSGLEPTVLISKGDEKNYGTLSGSIGLRNRRDYEDRTLTKDGEIRFIASNIEHQGLKFLTDGFTSILEMRWRWALLAFALSYFLSWTFFALLWWMIAYAHSDLENINNPNWVPCVSNIDGFVTAFLYSLETQQTIGFGYYHVGTSCPEAVTLLGAQSIWAVLLDGIMVGLIFVKMSRAKKRSATIMFSKNALVCMRDGMLYLMIRVGDMRTKSHLLEAHIRVQFISKKTTREGEVIKYHQQELEISGDGEKDSRILLFWPTVILHKIDSTSPLYNVHPKELNDGNDSFEIIVILEGINESTGLTMQARTSYLPREILWGYRFQDLHSSKTDSGHRVVDYHNFNNSHPSKIPYASAAMINEQVQTKEEGQKVSS